MTLTTMILSQIKRLLKKNWNLNVLSKESQTFDPNQMPKHRKDRFEYILSRLRYAFANQHNELYNGYLVVMKKNLESFTRGYMNKNYYILTKNNNIEFIGQFENFATAWDYLEYNINKDFIYLFNEKRLKELSDNIDFVLNKLSS